MANSTLHPAQDISFTPKGEDRYDSPVSYDLLLNERSRILVVTVVDSQVVNTSCHVHASKQITILGGCAEIILRDSCQKLYEGQSISIPNGTAHKIVKYGKIPLKYVEIRTGPYVMDDDHFA